MFDYDPGESYALANIPEKVRVWFKRREEYHGIEKDSPDTAQWEMTPVVSKDHTTGVTGAQTGSFVNVWDDLPALFDETDANSNAADLQTRADEVGANIEAALVSEADGLRRVYSGLVTNIQPGSEVFSVVYRDYGDGNGLVTEIARGPMLSSGAGVEPPSLNDANFPPTWPRLGQPVQVDDGASSTGASLSPNSDGLFPGFVLRNFEGDWTQLEACWIQPADLHTSNNEATSINLKQKDRFHGRLSGNDTSGGVTLPLYIVRGGSVTGANTYDWDVTADGPTGPFTIAAQDTVHFDGADEPWTELSVENVGVLTRTTDAGATTTVQFGVNQTVAQVVQLSGDWTTTGPVNVTDGTPNKIEFDATLGTTPPFDITAAAGVMNFSARNPFHVIDGDGIGPEDLDYTQTLEFTSGDGTFNITKAADTVTVDFVVDVPTVGLPIGSVIMGVLKPIKDGSFWYLDRAGVADTDWALMDGSSNGGGQGGSGVQMATATGGAVEHFVRAKSHDGTTPADAGNTPVGRDQSSTSPGGIDQDEVLVEVADHPSHTHTINTDVCDEDHTGTDSDEWQFTTQNPQTGGPSATLTHNVNLTNNQADSGDTDIEMLPSHQKLYFFERIAVTT
jgi:hypothetical protein